MKVLQAAIVQRFYQGKDYDAFIESYKNSRHKSKTIKEPSAKDLRIASHVRQTLSAGETARALGIGRWQVWNAVARVGTYNSKVPAKK